MKTMRILLLAALVFAGERSEALTIVRIFDGGTPPTNSVGGGNLRDIVNAACDVWQLAIRDDAVLTLHFKWAPVNSAVHFLGAEGGIPNREIVGTISFNNAESPFNSPPYLDPSPLLSSCENGSYVEQMVDLGGGAINATRWITNLTACPPGYVDLFTDALHEIGHALGLCSDNHSFQALCIDGNIPITDEPFAGTIIPLDCNNSGFTSHIGWIGAERPLMSSYTSKERVFPDAVSIKAAAQVSRFKDLNLNLAPILAISAASPEQQAKGMPATAIGLSWIQPLPVPAGTTHYVIQRCTDLGTGDWSTVECSITQSNGYYSASVLATPGNSFFRLKAE